MKITVLDGYTLNPDDLSWDELAKLGEFTVYDRTASELILERSAGSEILLTNKTPLMADTISQLPDLKYIGVLATGYNVVDVKAASQNGVVVTNVPTYGTDSVAQMAFALLLALCRRVQVHSDAVKQGEWSQSEDFCFWKFPQVELSGKTMGIIGFGRIGRQVARIADAMGMRIIAADEFKTDPPQLNDFQWSEIPDLLKTADVVSLHCPQTPDTESMINKETIGLMKETAILVNNSRGGLVVDDDLAEALNSGRIAGAALDVLSTEPPNDNPLLKAKNCLITPHISWATQEARARLMDVATRNVKAFQEGKPINMVAQ